MKQQSSIKLNFLYNTIYQVLLVILPLITSPYISRVLSDDGLGIYSYQYTIANCFALVGMLGVNNYGNRSIAAVRDDKEKRSQVFWSIWILQAFLSVVVSIAYLCYVEFFCIDEHKTVAIALWFEVLASVFNINWFFFGLEKFKLTVTRNIVIKLLSVLLIFLFVKSKSDVWIYSLIIGGTLFLSNIFIWPFLKKEVKKPQINICEILHHFSQMAILFVPVIAITLYNKMDKVMLGSLSTMSETGLYENTEKIVNIPSGLITALGTVMLPRMSYLFANNDQKSAQKYFYSSLEFACAMSYALAFGLAAIGKEFAPWFFGSDFTEVGILMMALSPKIVFLCIANVVRTQYLIPLHQDKVFLVSVWVGAVVNLIVNVLLIPNHGAMGAIIGTNVAEFTVMAYQILMIRKEVPIISSLLKNSYYFVAGVLMFVVVRYIGKTLEGGFLCVIFEIICGVLVYGILCTPYLYRYHKSEILYVVNSVKYRREIHDGK